ETTGPAPTARRAINGRRLPSPDQGPADAEQESPPSGVRLADRVDVLANAAGQSRGGAATQSNRRSLPLVPDTQPLDVTARASAIRRVTAEEPADAVVAAGPLGSWLYYPDSDIPIADVAARLVLVSIQEGDLARAEWELARFRSRHGEAPGELAGRREPWVKLLDDWLKAARTWSTPTVGRDWTTWGGAASRGRAAERDVDPAGKPRWTVELPRLTAPPDLDGRAARRVGESAAGLLSYHPVVVAGKVLLQTSDGMSAWELATGRPAFPPLADSPGTPGLWFATNELAEWLKLDSGRVGGVPRFTLSASSDGVVWGKAGAPWAPGFEARKRPKPAAIVGFDLSAEGKVVLRLDGTGDEADESWAWEGPPIVADGRLFVALRKGDTLETESHVACFDATTGRLRWRRFLAAAENAKQRRVVEWTHDLLALSEDSLYVQTHAGVVASLDVRDGRLNWLTAYPRSTLGDDAPAQQRDLAPCLIERDLVVVAPRDSERLHAFDAVSGRQVWMNDGPQASDATQLLGVGAGRLVTGGDALQWFDLATGRWQCRFPPAGTRATGTVRDAPRGHGRGLLAGPRVWWPTHDKLYVFDQQTQRTGQGWQPRAVREIEMTRRGATGGNLLI
ncbi:MAG TPA: PQQ-binding-like beta-propeller repeat protein, partial [Pirellulaceae bacterium]|nr:PQQ-binding-like beta-propeller repeat protein [Pirellulaceae bacterium]